MSVHFKFWSLSTVILGSKWSTFSSKARFELATLKTKQAFEKTLEGFLFHIGVVNYNCRFLNKATRWLDVYFGCSYLFEKVKNMCFVGDNHAVILQSDFFCIWIYEYCKWMRNMTRFEKDFHMEIKQYLLDRHEKNNQTILTKYLNSSSTLLRILSACRTQIYEWSQLTYKILVAGTCIFKDSEWIKMISNVCALAAFPTSYFTIIWQDKNRDKIYHPKKKPFLTTEKKTHLIS